MWTRTIKSRKVPVRRHQGWIFATLKDTTTISLTQRRTLYHLDARVLQSQYSRCLDLPNELREIFHQGARGNLPGFGSPRIGTTTHKNLFTRSKNQAPLSKLARLQARWSKYGDSLVLSLLQADNSAWLFSSALVLLVSQSCPWSQSKHSMPTKLGYQLLRLATAGSWLVIVNVYWKATSITGWLLSSSQRQALRTQNDTPHSHHGLVVVKLKRMKLRAIWRAYLYSGDLNHRPTPC